MLAASQEVSNQEMKASTSLSVRLREEGMASAGRVDVVQPGF